MPRQSLSLLTYFNRGVSLILAPVHRHVPSQAPAELSSQVPPQPQHTPALPAALRTGQPLMDAFSGVPAASERNVGTQRSESIVHSLPGGPFATLRGHSGPRRAYPATVTDPRVEIDVVLWPQNVDHDFDLPRHPSEPIKIKNADLKRYISRFADHHLVFNIKVPGQGVTSPAEFSRQLLAYLSTHNLTMPPFPSDYEHDGADDLDGQLWILLDVQRRVDVHTLSAHFTINDNTFGYAQFKKFTSKFPSILFTPTSSVPLPTATNPPPWIFIGTLLAPRFGNLVGPVATFSTPSEQLAGTHPCFGMRVIRKARRTTSDEVPECYENHCPAPASPVSVTSILSQLPGPAVQRRLPSLPAWATSARPTVQRPQTPPPQPSLIRQRSPGETQNALLDRRVDPIPQIPAAETGLIAQSAPQSPVSPPSCAISLEPVRPPMPSLERGVDFLEPSQIFGWRTFVAHWINRSFHAPMVHIHAKTITAAAKCLIGLLLHIENCKDNADSDFVSSDDVLHCTSTIQHESFFSDVRIFSIGLRGIHTTDPDSTRAVTQGPGPERATFREGCAILTTFHTYWQQATSSDMFRPIFTAIDAEIPERVNTFRAHGTFLALHCLLLRQGPLPISIWVLLALCVGREAMLIPQHVLLHLDPGAYNILAPWYDFHLDTPVPPAREATHPLRQFIIERMPQEMQPNLIRNHRQPEEHQAWIISAFAVVLLGHHSPWSHPEFIALQEGFNLGQHFTESIRQQNARPFLVTLYDRRIRAVDDVITHLKYLNPLRPRKTSAYFVKLFQLRLERYAHGRGHPNGVRCLNVTEEEFQLCRNDPLLRANLILRGGSDSDMRPMEPTWSINVRFLYCLSTYYSLTTPPVQVPRYWIQDVYLDLHLRDLLLEPLPMSPNRSTKFELWLHSQLLDRQHNTI
ncbi:hypothetical protein B0H12DRAFT_1306591 [Mycena haematopus]|nr:hypothetical protein B0H12DRAFT_1306591 [Mycena haematopus]